MGKKLRTIALIAGLSLIGTGVAYVGHFRPKAKMVEKVVRETNLPEELVKGYLDEGVHHGVIENFNKKGITPEIFRKLRKKNDISKTKQGWTAVSDIKGKEYEKWTDADFSIDEIWDFSEYKVSLEDAIEIRKALKDKKDLRVRWLRYQHIPTNEAVPLLKQGKSPDEIIKMYADAIGISVDDRRAYVFAGIGNNDDIRLLLEKGLKSQTVQDLSNTVWGHPKQKYKLPPERIIELTKDGKLSGEVYKEWESAGFYISEMALCLDKGYSLEEAKVWKDNGFRAKTMHQSKEKGYSLQEMIQFMGKLKALGGRDPWGQ